MRRMSRVGAVLMGAVCGFGPPSDARADEGQWMPSQIAELDPEMLRSKGLQLRPEEIWNPDDFGLMAAVVNLSGCSAAFVSDRGLIATNHHCAHAAILAQSTVERDYLTEGFLARKLEDEIPATGRTVQIILEITDVTARVRAVADAERDPAARALAVEKERKALVDACEAKGEGRRCRVASFYSGSTYQLFEAIELEDVRIVYAPPSAIGEYGGEIDNWMWPRHTGDFTLLRAYVDKDGKPAPFSTDNVPYQPRRWLEPSADGVAPGDFVAVLGFPGHTDRYLPAPEVQRQLEQFLPARIELYGEWIEIFEKAGAEDPAVALKVAAKLKRLANRHKNARGMIDGMTRMNLLARRQKEEAAMATWASEKGGAYAEVLPRLEQLAQERRARFAKEFSIHALTTASDALSIAIDLVRRAREAKKPDLERVEAYMKRGEKRLWQRIDRGVRDYDRAVDEAVLRALWRRIDALPAEDRFTTTRGDDLARLLQRTRVHDPAFVREMFDAGGSDDTAERVLASSDPMLALARELTDAIEALEAEERRREGIRLEIGPLYFEMVKAVRTGPVYPDANGTLRFSYATVQGYQPRDGMVATPQTTLAGQVAKHTGEDPFDLPDAVLAAASKAPTTYWSDPGLGDVPVCFLSNADTTGGNSGSAVIDGRGRWVGLNFDRVWENIAGDFGYNPARSRNIIVDLRYLLWTLDEIADAGELLEELGMTALREAGPRTRPAVATATPPPGELPNTVDPPAADVVAERGGCGCGLGGAPTSGGWLALGLLGVAAWRPRGRSTREC